eukprot:Em0001g935a
MESPALLGQKRSSMVLGAIQEHWKDDNFTVCKVDMSNAFNLVSRQALLEECAVHFPELLPWVAGVMVPTLHYGTHLDILHKLVLSIAQDKDCLSLLSNRWYFDDGVLSGHSQAVTRAVTLIQEMGPSLGLFINVSKSQKRADAAKLLSQLAEEGAEDPQVAFLLLWPCATFCKLVHLARSTPPSYVADGLALFDKDEVRSKLEVVLVLTGCTLVLLTYLSTTGTCKPAAFDLTVTSPLNPITLTEARVRCGSSALFAEARKHNANDSKCAELGWVCISLAVESYGCWGTEAQQSFSRLAARLAIQMGCSKTQATTIMYQRLSLSLVRANARALLSRARFQQSEEGG